MWESPFTEGHVRRTGADLIRLDPGTKAGQVPMRGREVKNLKTGRERRRLVWEDEDKQGVRLLNAPYYLIHFQKVLQGSNKLG